MQQLLKVFLNFKILIFLGLLFIGPNISILAQTPESANQIQEDHDTKNLDKVLSDYNKDQEKVLNDAAKIIQKDGTHELTDKEMDAEKDPLIADPYKDPGIKRTEFKLLDAAKKKNNVVPKKSKYSDTFGVALEPLQKLSEAELVKLLSDNTKGTSAAAYLERFPKIAVFAVRLIKDKKAIPNLVSILDDQDRLIHFSGIMLSTILLAFVLKRLMKKDGRSVVAALSFWFLRFLIMSCLRFGILLYFFQTELSPTLNIATKTFF